MTINLTDPQAPVPDEELDQMIWKLERDGMTPKMLSLMRELREVRRAKVVMPNAEEIPGGPDVPDYNVGWARGWNACRTEVKALNAEKLNQPVSETNKDE